MCTRIFACICVCVYACVFMRVCACVCVCECCSGVEMLERELSVMQRNKAEEERNWMRVVRMCVHVYV